MYYLDEKQFGPSMILFGVVFIPLILGLLIANVLYFRIELLIATLLSVLLYFITVLLLWKTSRTKRHYLLLNYDNIEISFLDVYAGDRIIKLSFDRIKRIEYYRLCSFKGWIMLFHSFVYPQSVFVTYIEEDKEQIRLIGYLNYNDVQKISTNINTELIVY